MRVGKACIFTYIHESHQVARLIVVALLVGYPHLNARDVDSRSDERQSLGVFVVGVVEILCEEEVAVLVVVVHIHRERGCLCSALGVHRLRLAVLLRHECRGCEFAKLHLGLDTEERCTTLDERRPRGHTHVSRLYELDYLVLLAFILQLEVLGIEVEGCIGVVGHVKLHFVAHRRINSGLNLLVEVEIGLSACIYRECRVVGLVRLHTHLQLYRTLCLELYSAGTEHLFKRSESKIHVEEVKWIFLCLGCFGIFLPIVALHRLREYKIVILVA